MSDQGARDGAPGPHNDITDVPDVKIGGAEDARVRTGVSVVLPDAPAIIGGDVRGGGPGTRETDLLDPSTLVERADAVVLAGGSVYGLGAADGAAAWLGAQGRGFQLIAKDGVPPSPIAPAAILYDLANGGAKDWGASPPYFDLGARACEAAARGPVALGRAGAGFGATAGDGPGGLGSASWRTADGLVVGALMAVNSFGSPLMPPGAGAAGDDVYWAWPYEIDGEFGGGRPSADAPPAADLPPDTKLAAAARTNTTIGVVAVNAALTQPQARRLAVMAQDGIARALRPVHGPTDGDVIFVLSTPPANAAASAPDPLTLTRLGLIAADVVARAIARGVYLARRAESP